MAQLIEIFRRDAAACDVVHTDCGHRHLLDRKIEHALQNDGDAVCIEPDQLRRLPGGADENDPVHMVADQKIKKLADIGIFRPAVAEHHMVAQPAGRLLQCEKELGKQRVFQIGDNTADNAGVAGAEGTGQQIPPVPLLAAEGKDLFACFRVHAGGVVQNPGDCGAGNIRQFGDIFDRNGTHRGLLITENDCTHCAKHRKVQQNAKIMRFLTKMRKFKVFFEIEIEITTF